jgi:hypothetical protein
MKETEKNRPLHSVWGNVWYLLCEIARADRLLLALLVVQAVCGVLSPLLGIYLPKLAVELVTRRADMREILGGLGGFTALLGAVVALRQYAEGAKYMRYNDLRGLYMRRLFVKTLDCDYMQIESPEGQTLYQRAIRSLIKGDWSCISRTVTGTLALFISAASFFALSGVLAALHPLILAMLIGLSAVNYFALRAARRYELGQRGEAAALEKKLNYIERTSMDVKAGKDVRLYGMERWFAGVREGLMALLTALQYRVGTRQFWAGMANALI